MAIDPIARALLASQQGGAEPEPLSVTENGTYTAEEGKAYSPVTVNVPNTYSQEDEGKVVDNGTLVEQTSITITQNSTVDTTLNNEVVVNVPSGSGGSENDDVRFFDYDGTLIKSYSADEFVSLESFPENPTHEGLISQGWNWSFEDAKSYVSTYGKLDIGQMYITDDGKTRLYVHLEKGRLHPYVGFGINGTAVIDWGDNSTSTVTGSSVSTLVYGDHEYTNEGDYVVTIDGNINIIGNNNFGRIFCKDTTDTATAQYVYLSCIQKIELGNILGISSYAFSNCYSLTSITIPNGVTSIGSSVFRDCYSLISVTIPSSVTSIRSYAFSNCKSLTSITIPNSVTSIEGSTFQYCTSLTSITIPSNVTSIGGSTFYECNSLVSVTIPDGVTSIKGSVFYSCYSLTSVTIPDSVTSIGYNAFIGCQSLASITIPSGVTSIGGYALQNCRFTSITIPNGVSVIGTGVFQYCYSLKSVIILDGVTNINDSAFNGCYSLISVTIPSSVTRLSNYVFNYCYSLTSITIPSSVTSIGSGAFNNCYGLGEIRFESTTPPTVTASNAWTGVPTDCKIYVPQGTLSAYTSATNYPSSSTYTYIEY